MQVAANVVELSGKELVAEAERLALELIEASRLEGAAWRALETADPLDRAIYDRCHRQARRDRQAATSSFLAMIEQMPRYGLKRTSNDLLAATMRLCNVARGSATG